MNLNSCLRLTSGSTLQGELPRQGQAALPGDKSISHRALILASLADGRSQIENLLQAGVTEVLLHSLQALGVEFELHGSTLELQGHGLQLGQPEPGLDRITPRLDCGNSATSMRLLAGLLSAWGRPALLDGSPGLRKRPMARIVEPLKLMGVPIESDAGCAPLVIGPAPRPLRSLTYRLPTASAQVKSCLAIAALAGDGVTTLVEPGASRDHTERMLRRQGVRVEQEVIQADERSDYLLRIHPPSTGSLSPVDIKIPGDFSAAAFLIVAAAITPGSQICLPGVGLNPTRTGLLQALVEMGADIQLENQDDVHGEPVGDIRVRYLPLHGIRVGGDLVVRMIDEFPAFAVAAACAEGETRVEGADELRYKESDRIHSLVTELSRLGVDIDETPDGFRVQGGREMRAAPVDHHGDHRLAMSLALTGLVSASPVVIRQPGIMRESFPGFIQALQFFGANLELVGDDSQAGGDPG